MKRKNRIKALLLVGVMTTAALLGGCSGKGKDQTSKIKKSGSLRVAIATGMSRLTTVDSEGNYKGLEPEIIRTIADNMELEVTYVPVEEGKSALTYLDEDQADLAIGSIVNDGSLDGSYGITTPYAYGYICVVTSRGNYVNSLSALTDCSIGVSDKLSIADQQKLNGVEAAAKNTYSDNDGKNALENGAIQAFICYEDEAVELIQSEGIFQAQNLTDVDSDGFVIATAKNNKNLLENAEIMSQAYLDAIDQADTNKQ